MLGVNRLKITRQMLRIAINVSIVAILATLFMLKDRFDREYALETEISQARATLTDLSKSITAKITRVLLVSSSLSGAVALKPDIDQPDFEELASKIGLSDSGIINIATIRDFKVDLVFPSFENASLVGRDLSEVPDQMTAALRARDTRQTVLQGPVDLLQGVRGYILREPVFIDTRDSPEFWGLISIVFSAEEFFSDVGLEEAQADYEIWISETSSGTPVFGTPAPNASNALHQVVDTPGGHWEISLEPHAGWGHSGESRTPLLLFLLSTGAALWASNILFNLRARALEASELLQSAINVLADAFVLYDRDDKLVVCNQKYLEFYAASAPAIVPGARFEDILRYGLEHGQYKDALGREEAWLQERLSAHRAANTMVEQRLEDGRWLRIREMSTPDGGRVGIRVDITEQVESRKRAEVAEARLRDAIDTVPAGFWLFDANEELELVNARALEPFMRTDQKIAIGDSLEDVVDAIVASEAAQRPGRRQKERKAHFMRLLRQSSGEFQIRTGRKDWYKYFSQRTQDGGLVCFGVNISENIQQEQWLHKTNIQLRRALADRDAAEARFSDVADIATEWFWEQDADGRLTYVSPGFEDMTGIPAAAVLGRNRLELASKDPDQESEALETQNQLVAARKPFKDVIYKTDLKPGAEIWIRTSGKPVFNSDGRFDGYIGTAANISLLYFAMREAQQADEAKTQFLNVVSHELRTPITIILGFNAFLAKAGTLPEFRDLQLKVGSGGDPDLEQSFEMALAAVQRYSEKIRVAGEQLQRLVNDILDLARIEARTLHVVVSPVDLGQTVRSIVDQMQPIFESKGVDMVVEAEDLIVRSDLVRLRQILTNLIANAVKFTDTGHIAIRARRIGDMAEIKVSDTGIGIPQEALSKIFDRFTQVDTSITRNQGGAGLGLAIAKDLIHLQGGTVNVESELGHGTTVTFTMPLWTDVDAEP